MCFSFRAAGRFLPGFLGVAGGVAGGVSGLGFGGFFRRDRVVKFLDILGSVGLELVVAAFAAELDLATLVHKCVRLAHAAELLVGDKAGVQWKGNHVGIRRLLITTAPGKQNTSYDAT